jgi:molybdate transport system regulatory protein
MMRQSTARQQLLETYFGPLAQRNTENQKWKRFPFAELGAVQGKPELRPPRLWQMRSFADMLSELRLGREPRQLIDLIGRAADGSTDDFLSTRRMRMKTSARNQFLGKVAAVKKGAVNDEIDLEILGGQKIVAIITRESTDSLGLRPGVEAYALIKASSVIIMTDDEGAKLSTRNRLAGKVSRVQPGAVNTEVVIELPGGGAIASIITHESAKALALETGKIASALFKASSVIIGVPN